MLLVLNISV